MIWYKCMEEEGMDVSMTKWPPDHTELAEIPVSRSPMGEDG